MTEIFKIRKDYGRIFVRDMEGNFVDALTIAQLIEELSATYQEMTTYQIEQEDIRQSLYADHVDTLLAECRVLYGLRHPFLEYEPGKARTPKTARFRGVYVLTHSTRPNSVKIGMSIDIYARTKTFYREFNPDRGAKFPVEVLAVIETRDMESLEIALHSKFQEWHIDGEWFQRDPVVRWLREMSQS